MENGNRNRNRAISEVDPLEEVAYRTQTHDQHDFAGVSALTEEVGRRASWTSQGSASTTASQERQARTTRSRFNSLKSPIHEEDRDDSLESSEAKEDPLFAGPLRPLEETRTTESQAKKKERKGLNKVSLLFIKSYLLLFVAFMGILAIYWGSWYNRTANLHNIQYLVVSDETTNPLITETFIGVFNSTAAASIGTFSFANSTQFALETAKYNRTNWEQVIHEVHEQNYYGGFYIPPNATNLYLESLQTLTAFNSTVRFVFETGREPAMVPGLVVAIVRKLQISFVQLSQKVVVMPLVAQLSTDQYTALVTTAPELLSTLWFQFLDYRPYDNPGFIGPLQIGFTYLLVLSFHQFNFASATHETMATKLRLRQYMVYHIITSHLSYFLLALVYCLMTLAFQIPYTRAFGYSGFLVLWAFVYLTMAALGGINENVAIQIFLRNRPLIGFWIVFFMVINLAPVFSPITVINEFYRYGYALPMYCGSRLVNVTLMNTSTRDVGRNIGILIAWIALTNIILPFNIRSVKRYKKEAEEKAQRDTEASGADENVN